MRAQGTFQVWAGTLAEAEAKAEVQMMAIVGPERQFSMTLRGTAVHQNSGNIITIEWDVVWGCE